MSDGDVSFAVATYRYLRLAIVVVLVALLASVVFERFQTDCWQGSLSAYYYTPVQPIFVGALIAIGVSFVAIKGSTEIEDLLLNVAGVVAPIVAVVPTAPSEAIQRCASAAIQQPDQVAFIDNNVVALIVAGGAAVVIGWIAARRAVGDAPGIDRSSLLGIGFAVVFMAIGVGWYTIGRESFLERAHGAAAVVFFLALLGTIVVNASTGVAPYRWWYAATAAAMVVGAAIVLVVGIAVDEWQHQVLVLELVALVPVVVYWAVQTVEHWGGGGDRAPYRPAVPGSPAAATSSSTSTSAGTSSGTTSSGTTSSG